MLSPATNPSSDLDTSKQKAGNKAKSSAISRLIQSPASTNAMADHAKKKNTNSTSSLQLSAIGATNSTDLQDDVDAVINPGPSGEFTATTEESVAGNITEQTKNSAGSEGIVTLRFCKVPFSTLRSDRLTAVCNSYQLTTG